MGFASANFRIANQPGYSFRVIDDMRDQIWRIPGACLQEDGREVDPVIVARLVLIDPIVYNVKMPHEVRRLRYSESGAALRDMNVKWGAPMLPGASSECIQSILSHELNRMIWTPIAPGDRFHYIYEHIGLPTEDTKASASFPHSCPRCRAPAYIGLMRVDCSGGCNF